MNKNYDTLNNAFLESSTHTPKRKIHTQIEDGNHRHKISSIESPNQNFSPINNVKI